MNSSNVTKEKTNTQSSQTKKVVKKRRLRSDFWEIMFILFSIIFIVSCCIFYGNRLFKYYRIYNPKPENGEEVKLLSNSITESSKIVSEGDGLYRLSGSYIYKGENVDNYLEFSGYLFRIMKINSDGSIRLILEDEINYLKYDMDSTKYLTSDIHEYVNDIFLKTLDTEKLGKTSICLDTVSDLNSFTCDNTNTESYVALASINDYLNSKVEKSYMISDIDDAFWLSSYNDSSVWHTNGDNLSKSEVDEFYQVKPVITLKNSNVLYGGTGSKEAPYIIEKENDTISIGSYVELGEDVYLVYGKEEDNLRLVMDGLYKDGNTKYRFDLKTEVFDVEKNSSLAKYLNTTVYESLDYQDVLVDATWYVGSYEKSYQDIYEDTVKAKVGLLNVADIKVGTTDIASWLMTAESDGKVYVLDTDGISSSKVTLSRAFRPAVVIKKDSILSGSGSKEDPYKVVK